MGRIGGESGTTLKTETGLLEIGPPAGALIAGISESARTYGIAVNEFSNEEARKEFPQFQIPDDSVAIFERQAGYLAVEQCVTAHIEQAVELGGMFETDTVVKEIVPAGTGVLVKTENESFSAASVIVAGGAWTRQLLPDLPFEITVVSKHQHWIEPPSQYWHLGMARRFSFTICMGSIFMESRRLTKEGSS